MRNKHTIRSLALGAVLLFSCALAYGQEAELPYYAERITKPNIMLFIDTSGSMAWEGEPGTNPRTRMEVIKHTIAGRPMRSLVSTNKDMYIPLEEADDVGNFNVLDHDLDTTSIRVFRVQGSGSTWDSYIEGPYFVFANATSAYDDETDTDTVDAMSSLDKMLRAAGVTCIHKVGDYNIADDDSSLSREVWEVSSTCPTGDANYLSFRDALKTYYYYEESGVKSVEHAFVVPVTYIAKAPNTEWVDRAGTTRRGLCYATSNNCTTTTCFRTCYKPYTNDAAPLITLFNDFGVTNAEELNDHMTDLSVWSAATGAEAICPSGTSAEVWGDRRYSDWTWWSNNTRPLPRYLTPRTDNNGGTMPTNRTLYSSCSLGSSGAIPLARIQWQPDSFYQNAIIADLTRITLEDREPEPFDGTVGPEFFKSTTGTRIDTHLRTVYGLSPTTLPASDIDLSDPEFGGVFNLYYDFLVNPTDFGIMDMYLDVNYGLMTFDNNTSCTFDDFPHGTPPSGCTNDGSGANHFFNVTSWADFPAYASYTSSKIENARIQAFIADPTTMRPNGNTPISSSIFDLYRYFHNDAVMATWPIRPGMEYDLGHPNASGHEDFHIIQDDPNYINGCRRNYVIYLTDGEQTSGESSTLQDDRVRDLKNRDGAVDLEQSVKFFIIGVGDDFIPGQTGYTQAVTMALASDLPGDTSPADITTPFTALNPTELRAGLEQIMSSIMEGHYARTAPKISTQEDAVITNFFDIIPTYPLWQGHLMVWRPDESGVPENADPYWTINDLGQILHNLPEGNRNMFTAVNSDLDRISFEMSNNTELEPHIDWTDSLDQDITDGVIELLRGVSGAEFADGSPLEWELGPTFHSRPMVVRKPGFLYYDTAKGYRDYIEAKADRPSFIVSGSGYGMLHGFKLVEDDAEGGEEFFAYLPEGVLRYLPNLYYGLQIYGVDGVPVVDDSYGDFDTATEEKEWATVIMSGLGGGGTAYFALDVTDVDDAFDDEDVKPLWNFRDVNLGNTWSNPIMTLIRRVDASDGWTIEPAAFFGGGVNPDPEEETNIGSGFYAIDVADASIIKKWLLPDRTTTDDDFRPYPEVLPTDDNSTEIPGSPIILDYNNDGFYDRAYVGDLEGRLWKFDMTDPDPANWKSCLFYDITDLDFSAQPGDTVLIRPLWYTPTLVKGEHNDILVYLSTGHVETYDEARDRNTGHYLYAFVDNDPGNSCTYAQSLMVNYSDVTAGDSATHLADIWPMAFESGERLISTPMVVEGMLIFKTYNPTEGVCTPGQIRLWVVDYLTQEAVMDLDGDGTPDQHLEVNDPGDLALDEDGNIVGTNTEDGGLQSDVQIVFMMAYPMSWGEGVAY